MIPVFGKHSRILYHGIDDANASDGMPIASSRASRPSVEARLSLMMSPWLF
jgi:hypothetical protein